MYIKETELGKFYYKDKKMTILHREDGPAAEYSYGVQEYWLNGKLHRENGPARKLLNSEYKEYWLNGERHNKNGPAIEFGGGFIKVWYLNGEEYSEEEFNEKMKFT